MRTDFTRRALGARRPLVLMVALVAIAACVAACGSSSSSSGKDVVSSKMLAEARANTQASSKVPQSIGVTQKLPSKPTPGKKIVFLYPDAPAGVASLKGVEAATKLLGYKLISHPLGATQDENDSIINFAQRSNPNGVIISNLDPALWAQAKAQWTKEGIPIVNWGTSAQNVGNVVNFVTPQFVNTNETKMMDWAVADAGGKKVNMLFVGLEGVPCCSSAGPVLEARLHQLCPTCGFTQMKMTINEVGQDAPGKIVTFLQQHPQYNYVSMVIGDFAIGLPAALSSAGLQNHVKIISTSGEKTNYQYIKSGQQAADVAWALEDMGWLSVDAMARGIEHQSLAPDQKWVVPTQLVTTGNLPWSPNEDNPGVPDKAQKWGAIWRLNG